MIKVLVFEGGSAVDENNVETIYAWSRDALIELISEFMGGGWSDERIQFTETEITCGESLEIVSDNFAQAVASSEGGMIYIVRR